MERRAAAADATGAGTEGAEPLRTLGRARGRERKRLREALADAVVGAQAAAELKEAATHFERAGALCPAPAVKAALAGDAALCRRRAEAM